MRNKKIAYINLIILFAFIMAGCGVYNAIKNISHLKFKLQSANNFSLNGIQINNKSKINDFNAVDLLKLTSAFANKKFPVTFTLNVEAHNPNAADQTINTSISISDFPWRLYIDDKETISGNISTPVTVPGGNQSAIIPLSIQLDLFKFFGDQGYERIINLALKLGGQGGSATNIKLVARPTISTAFGKFIYPDELTIISKELR